MIGQWISTIVVRFPRVALRGQAVLSTVANMTAAGVKSLLGYASFAASAGMASASARYRAASSSLSISTTMVCAGITHGVQYWGVVLLGSDAANGTGGTPLVSVTNSARGKMFVGGVNASSGELGSVIPLVATIEGALGETPATGLADDLFTRISNAAFVSAAPIWTLRPAGFGGAIVGSAAYALGLSQVTAARSLIGSTDYLGVLAVAYLQGRDEETWGYAGYAAALQSLQTAYDTDIKAITGQSRDVVLAINQYAWDKPATGSQNADPTVAMAWAAVAAHRANPSKILLVGPEYRTIQPAPYTPYGAHAHRAMGATISRVLARFKTTGSWIPLLPLSIARTGAVIDVTFNVPTGPLVLDERRVLNPGMANADNAFGFKYVDSTSSAYIVSVGLLSATVVRITLNTTPSGADRTIRYAFNNVDPGAIGMMAASRGCLRDSNNEPNAYGYDTFNWCCAFYDPVP